MSARLSIVHYFNACQNEQGRPVLSPQALQNHLSILGDEGTGKTTTCIKLLEGLPGLNSSFLAVSSKGNGFRHLADSPRNLRLVTYSEPSPMLVCINPFEIVPGCHLSEHIERVTNLFSSCFDLSKPVSHALQLCIEKAYEGYGWNTVSGKNRRLLNSNDNGNYNSDWFPSLTDVFEAIEDGVNACNFEPLIKTNTRFNLQNILMPLLRGRSRFIFGQTASASLSALFSKPTVIELNSILEPVHRSLYLGTLVLHAFEHRSRLKDMTPLVFLVDDIESFPGIFFSKPEKKPFAAEILRSSKEGKLNFVLSASSELHDGKQIMVATEAYALHRVKLQKARKSISEYLIQPDETAACLLEKLKKGHVILLESKMPATNHAPLKVPAPRFADTTRIDRLIESSLNPHKAGLPVAAMCSGCKYSPFGFDVEIHHLAETVFEDERFRATFSRYVLSTSKNLTQLVHFRRQIIDEVQRILGNKQTSIVGVTFCGLGLATDAYYAAKGKEYSWTYEEQQRIKDKWFGLIQLAFLPSDVMRRLDISELRDWRDDFSKLKEKDQGPLPTCGPCTSKCMYNSDVLTIINDRVSYDYNSALNRKNQPASKNAAWFTALLSERSIGQFDADLAFCLAVHLTNEQRLSVDAQAVLLHKAKKELEEFSREEADKEQAIKDNVINFDPRARGS